MIHVLINSGELQWAFVPKSIRPSPVNRDGLSIRIKRFCLFLYRDVTDTSDNRLMFYIISRPIKRFPSVYYQVLFSDSALRAFRLAFAGYVDKNDKDFYSSVFLGF